MSLFRRGAVLITVLASTLADDDGAQLRVAAGGAGGRLPADQSPLLPTLRRLGPGSAGEPAVPGNVPVLRRLSLPALGHTSTRE